MNSLTKFACIGALGISAYGGFLAWRAHTDLVTLHVRNAPLPKVIASLRWQTWESFIANRNVDGTVTLDVDKMPLESVLAIIGEQLNARWTTIYPIYRDKTSLISLKRALRGEAQLADTQFASVGGESRGFHRPPGEPVANTVSLHLTNTDLAIGAMALERFGGGQVAVEKGSSPRISLELNGVPFASAVRKVATAAHRSVTRFYALQAMRPLGRMDLAQAPRRPEFSGRAEDNPGADAERAERMEQILQTLPEEERRKVEERQLERAAMQSLTPEQRQQVMADRMNSPEMQQRAEQRATSGIKNTTPEQRRDRYERMYQMRKARAAGAARRG